jgi:hypothetical protein
LVEGRIAARHSVFPGLEIAVGLQLPLKRFQIALSAEELRRQNWQGR